MREEYETLNENNNSINKNSLLLEALENIEKLVKEEKIYIEENYDINIEGLQKEGRNLRDDLKNRFPLLKTKIENIITDLEKKGIEVNFINFDNELTFENFTYRVVNSKKEDGNCKNIMNYYLNFLNNNFIKNNIKSELNNREKWKRMFSLPNNFSDNEEDIINFHKKFLSLINQSTIKEKGVLEMLNIFKSKDIYKEFNDFKKDIERWKSNLGNDYKSNDIENLDYFLEIQLGIKDKKLIKSISNIEILKSFKELNKIEIFTKIYSNIKAQEATSEYTEKENSNLLYKGFLLEIYETSSFTENQINEALINLHPDLRKIEGIKFTDSELQEETKNHIDNTKKSVNNSIIPKGRRLIKKKGKKEKVRNKKKS